MKNKDLKEIFARGGGEFFEIRKNRKKLIKTLIIHLISYSEAKSNEQKVKILVEIYLELKKYNQTPKLIIGDFEFNKEDIFEELFYILGNLGVLSIETIQARVATFIKTLGGEPSLLLEKF
ncbi:TPA: hypothetical protein SHD65_001347 [Campylobacter coli]|nr:hypothetical protein [Campylobacter coli]